MSKSRVIYRSESLRLDLNCGHHAYTDMPIEGVPTITEGQEVHCHVCMEVQPLKYENARLELFAKIVFAHLYGDIIKDVCEWRGDHLSRSNIELIEKVKQKLEQ